MLVVSALWEPGTWASIVFRGVVYRTPWKVASHITAAFAHNHDAMVTANRGLPIPPRVHVYASVTTRNTRAIRYTFWRHPLHQ